MILKMAKKLTAQLKGKIVYYIANMVKVNENLTIEKAFENYLQKIKANKKAKMNNWDIEGEKKDIIASAKEHLSPFLKRTRTTKPVPWVANQKKEETT